jgi:hypothetical protein
VTTRRGPSDGGRGPLDGSREPVYPRGARWGRPALRTPQSSAFPIIELPAEFRSPTLLGAYDVGGRGPLDGSREPVYPRGARWRRPALRTPQSSAFPIIELPAEFRSPTLLGAYDALSDLPWDAGNAHILTPHVRGVENQIASRSASAWVTTMPSLANMLTFSCASLMRTSRFDFVDYPLEILGRQCLFP